MPRYKRKPKAYQGRDFLTALPLALQLNVMEHLSKEDRLSAATVSKPICAAVRQSLRTLAVDITAPSRALRLRAQAFSAASHIVFTQSLDQGCNTFLWQSEATGVIFDPLWQQNTHIQKDDGVTAHQLRRSLGVTFGQLSTTAGQTLTVALELKATATELEQELARAQVANKVSQVNSLYGQVALDGGLAGCLATVSTCDKEITRLSKLLQQESTVYSKLAALSLEVNTISGAMQIANFLSPTTFPALQILGICFKPTLRGDLPQNFDLVAGLAVGPSLQELHLSNVPLPQGFLSISHFSALHTLRISYDDTADEEEEGVGPGPGLNMDGSLSVLTRLAHLRHLVLHSLADDVGLSALTQLEHLEIRPEEDSTLTEFHAIPNLQRLVVDLGSDSDGMDLVAPFGNLHLPDVNGLCRLESLEVRSLMWQGGHQNASSAWTHVPVFIGGEEDDGEGESDEDDESVGSGSEASWEDNASEASAESDASVGSLSDFDVEEQDEEEINDEINQVDVDNEEGGAFEHVENQGVGVEGGVEGGVDTGDIDTYEEEEEECHEDWDAKMRKLESRYICALLRKIPSLKSITLSDFYVAPEFVTNIKEQAPCTSKLQGQLWTVTVAEKKVDGGLSEFNLMWQRT